MFHGHSLIFFCISVYVLAQKKSRSAIKDVSFAEAQQIGTLSEFSFFEKVMKEFWEMHVYVLSISLKNVE